ncbi:MAG: CoA ester lyase [Gemmatimonadetes bacterium]|nr:CoA ester lyase [Gemmatimonadota bacterium]
MTFPRSLLFVPANRTAMFARAFAAEAGAIVLDLEDSVPADQKAAARDAVATLQLPGGWARPIFVRLNAHGTADFDLDVRAAAAAAVGGVILPKVERAADVRAVDKALAARERGDRRLSLILLLETPGGVMRVAELADCGLPRVVAFAFGAEDYRAGVGVDALGPALADFARATIANAAAAAHLPAIDAPYLQVNDLDGLRAAARRARALGFQAKFAIHPSQVPVIHEEFAGGEDRAWATRVVEVYQRAVGEGKGSVALDGRMIDEATMKRARDILRA